MGSVSKGQPWWKSSGVDWKAYSETFEHSLEFIKLKLNIKQLSEGFQKIITNLCQNACR